MRFARNLLALSLAALTLPLAAYIAFRPGAAEMLRHGGSAALWLLIRQVVVNGLPVVFIATWAGAVLHGTARRGRPALLIDAPLRLAVLALLHAAVFVFAAGWFGSFGGDRMTALRVVAPTLARAAAFENLSGVYLYATLLASLPAQAATLRRGGGRWRRAAAGMIAWTLLCVAAFTLLSSLAS
ncbi:hypothetical protein MWU52_01250 [Jannaschia sp. S6380]|uniref:hypothetical protein n=1 Tax=Jannaschia sp. S6380 TaxID=2926408 RepID=UPI001FF49EEE|nr:hypothetical protein [Jannaschia sp. S6380]MCK0166170.1 hypothetical protein [Jannaschia sp. S6380]